ncbi:hypothetical protein [Halobacterium litoreum]|uniref:Uncharacterized protein n=1 Tax=Halobacterium litoreum TaxID=2039234 RepID=A0ABD5NC60_9EURY|nr:hypothetical protein [Halobacterium litoreum]UHH14247.1 hypothetical protein LT972_04410 [Halobacterium litoreum]
MSDWWRLACVSVSLAVLVWAALGPGGLASTTGLQHDTESTNASFAGADDLTVEATSVTVAPGALASNASGDVTVSMRVPSPERVNESSLAVTFAGASATLDVPASAVTCDDECRISLSEERVASLADGTGKRELVVLGWWEYDRQFVARAQVTIRGERGAAPAGNGTTTGNGTTNATTTANATATTTETTTNRTATTTANTTTQTTTATTPTQTTTTTTTTTATETTERTTTETSTTTTTESTTSTSAATTTAANRTDTTAASVRGLPSLAGSG